MKDSNTKGTEKSSRRKRKFSQRQNTGLENYTNLDGQEVKKFQNTNIDQSEIYSEITGFQNEKLFLVEKIIRPFTNLSYPLCVSFDSKPDTIQIQDIYKRQLTSKY